MKWRHLLLALLPWGALAAEAAPATILRAVDFGAIPDDGRDDTEALRRLFAAAATTSGAMVRLQAGRYEVSSGNEQIERTPIFQIENARSLTIDGQNAHLAITGIAPLFDFRKCADVQLSKLTIDWVVRPAVGLRVVSLESDCVKLQQETAGPTTDQLPLQALYLYDLPHRRPAPGRDECYWLNGDLGPRLSPLGDGTFSLPLNAEPSPVSRLKLRLDDRLVARFAVYGSNALNFFECENVRVEQVKILSAPSMGIVGLGTTGMTLDRIEIVPAAGQWISSNADATHFAECRGEILVRDSIFEAMGDDGLNLHSDLLKVRSLGDNGEIVLERGKDSSLPIISPPRVGDGLRLARSDHPLSFQESCIVESVSLEAGHNEIKVRLRGLLPAWLRAGCTVADSNTSAALSLERVWVLRNRARGILVQTAGPVRIAGCRFEDSSGSGVQITSDVGIWWEGPPAKQILIASCSFVGGNDGIGSRGGQLNVFADGMGTEIAEPVHRGLVVRDNVFERYTGAAVRIGSAEDVVIRSNDFFGHCRPISTFCSRTIELTDNRLLMRGAN